MLDIKHFRMVMSHDVKAAGEKASGTAREGPAEAGDSQIQIAPALFCNFAALLNLTNKEVQARLELPHCASAVLR